MNNGSEAHLQGLLRVFYLLEGIALFEVICHLNVSATESDHSMSFVNLADSGSPCFQAGSLLSPKPSMQSMCPH